MKEELRCAETSIESLNAQILALGSTDTIERMREQHESIVTTLRKESEAAKHDLSQQVADLKQRLHTQVVTLMASPFQCSLSCWLGLRLFWTVK